MAASLAIVATGSWQLATTRANGEKLTQTVLESHVRSLIGEHLTDVVSSDLHTVKPWFNGRLDFRLRSTTSPDGDIPFGRAAGVRWRAESGGPGLRAPQARHQRLPLAGRRRYGTRPPAATRHGYHLLHWNRPDFTYWVVSDLGEPELKEFAGLLQQADSLTAAPR